MDLGIPLPGQGGQQPTGSVWGSEQEWGHGLSSQLTSPSWENRGRPAQRLLGSSDTGTGTMDTDIPWEWAGGLTWQVQRVQGCPSGMKLWPFSTFLPW